MLSVPARLYCHSVLLTVTASYLLACTHLQTECDPTLGANTVGALQPTEVDIAVKAHTYTALLPKMHLQVFKQRKQ